MAASPPVMLMATRSPGGFRQYDAEKIQNLKRMESTLSDWVQSCSGQDVPDCPLIDQRFNAKSNTPH